MPSIDYQKEGVLSVQLEGSDESTPLVFQNLIVRESEIEPMNNTIVIRADFTDLNAVEAEVKKAIDELFYKLIKIKGFDDAILEWGDNDRYSLKNAIEQGMSTLQGQSKGGDNKAKNKERELVIAYWNEWQQEQQIKPKSEQAPKKQFYLETSEKLKQLGLSVSASSLQKWTKCSKC
jgi:hypothetical protein